jgi:antitoxin HicB
MEKDIKYYLSLPYTREIIPEPEGGWFVSIKELPGCMSQGDTPEEAMEMIQEAMEGWLEVALDYERPIPEPKIDDEFSGKFVLRVPKSVHRKLVETASDEGVSLNQWLVSKLSETAEPGKVIKQKSSFDSLDQNLNLLNWPGLTSDVRSILLDFGMNYKTGELDELCFSEWLAQGLEKTDRLVSSENLLDAMKYLLSILEVLDQYQNRSPMIRALSQLLSFLHKSIDNQHKLSTKNNLLISKELKVEKLIGQLSSEISVNKDNRTLLIEEEQDILQMYANSKKDLYQKELDE